MEKANQYEAEYDRYGASIRTWVDRMIRDRDETEDVVQDVWVALLRRGAFERAELSRNASGYIYQATRNIVKDYFKAQSAQCRRATWVGSIDDAVERVNNASRSFSRGMSAVGRLVR